MKNLCVEKLFQFLPYQRHNPEQESKALKDLLGKACALPNYLMHTGDNYPLI